MTRYNIVGFYPEKNEWYLIALGNNDKEAMLKKIEEVKANPKKYGLFTPGEVTDFKLEEISAEEDKKAWWNW